jgi:hypothetical protein
MTDEFQEPPKIPQEVWDQMQQMMREAEQLSGITGPDEPLVWGERTGSLTEDGEVVWQGLGKVPTKPTHYYPNGEPIVDDELMPAFMKWALLFEQRDDDRIVGQCNTLYGEKLSTVWLGLDHNWGGGPPLIFETMLFAPDANNVRRRTITALRDAAMGQGPDPEALAERDRHEAYIAKHYPHDQLQLRYSTREEAETSHEKLKLQCLIPPRWRHFLCWTIGQDPTWRRWEDGDEE